MWGAIKKAGRVFSDPIGAAADVVGGLIPGDQSAGAIAGGVSDAASSAWDVLSGERDWRRQKALQQETWDREDSAYQRMMADLEKAGINPMLAGQLGGSPTSPATARSHSAESVGRVAQLAGGIASGSAGVMKTLTELGAIKANTALQLAQASSTTTKLPVEVKKLIAETATQEAMTPNLQAGTALKVEQAKQTGVRTQQMRYEMPRFHAESEFYRRYGSGAFSADKFYSPGRALALAGDRALAAVGRRTPAGATAVNSALSVMDREAIKLKERRSRSYNSLRSNYYTRR